jgi:uncharacterized LabA/DUF88 family protein
MVAPARRKAAGFFISTLMETVVFIDFENLKGKIKEVFRSSNKKPPSWRAYDFACLLTKSLRGEQPDRKNIYHATLKVHPDTKEKSLELISELRFLKTSLPKQGLTLIPSGTVRGAYTDVPFGGGAKILTFREKGVDVRMAVDMVAMACDGKLTKAIIGSSDSDLQPAVTELRNRGVKTVYLGFEHKPNRGLIYTTDDHILIKNTDVLECGKAAERLLLPLSDRAA